MPLLYGYPADLAAMGRALATEPVHAVIDRWLTAPFVHELAHLGRRRRALYPPYLDECVAGYFGVRVLPEFAFPAPGETNALYAAPWFAQVGQALARAVGWQPLLRAHAGLLDWDAALPPPLCRAVARLGWDDYRGHRDTHFLTSNYRPEPWMKLGFLGAAGRPIDTVTLAELEAVPWAEIPAGPETPLDADILGDALRAMCLDNRLVNHDLPRRPPRARADRNRPRGLPRGHRAGPRRPRPGAAELPVPPATAARLRAAGLAGFDVTLPDASDAALADAAGAILSSTPSDSVRPRGSS